MVHRSMDSRSVRCRWLDYLDYRSVDGRQKKHETTQIAGNKEITVFAISLVCDDHLWSIDRMIPGLSIRQMKREIAKQITGSKEIAFFVISSVC